MALPTPQQFQNVIISEDDAVCDQLQKLVTMTKLISDVYGEIYDSSGNLTADFLSKVCDLDCTGTGGPGGTTTAAPSTTTSTTTTFAPGVDSNIYMFYSKVVSGNLNGFFRVVDGATFDSTRVVSYGSEIAVATNEVVVASALHPTTGDLWVAHVDGTLGTAQDNLHLSTINKATGALTSVGDIGDNFAWATDQFTTHMTFDRSDNTLWLYHDLKLGQVDQTTAAWTSLTLGTGAGAWGNMDGFCCGADGTFYVSGDSTYLNAGKPIIMQPDKTDSDVLYPGKIPILNNSSNITTLFGDQHLILRGGEFSAVQYSTSQTTWFRTDATPSNVFSLSTITPTITANLTADMPDLMAVAYNAT